MTSFGNKNIDLKSLEPVLEDMKSFPDMPGSLSVRMIAYLL